MANKKISYTVRDFQSIRTELINFVKTYYPDLLSNVNDASVFSVLLDLNAAVSDNLQFQIDRSIQETVLQYAQQRSSVYNIARTYGLKIPGQRPSVALVDFIITVPAFGDREDTRYCGILRRGSQVQGAGQTFETVYDIDFTSPVNNEGFPNRTKIPNFDSNGIITSYQITKRETVVNGVTKVFKKVILPNDVRPFFELFLPEKNVLNVTSVLLKEGTQYAGTPPSQDFLGLENRWYEVDALIQDKVFVEDPTKVSDSPGIKVGKYISTSNKFITEYTPESFFKMTFGGGSQSSDEQLREFAANGFQLNLSRYSNNLSLGSTLTPNSTLFVQYRVGGGISSNLGVNVINQLGTIDFSVNGPSEDQNVSTVGSLRCNNPTAAIGGANLPTVEEVRNYVGYNFSSQKRAVTINDYESLIRTMPSQFGSPAKVAITEQENKIKIKCVSYDTSGKLTNLISNTLKSNIANYLSNYRMINDYISVESAQVIDLSLDISVVLDSSQNQGSVITQIVNSVNDYFAPTNREMGQNVYISEIRKNIQSLNGVISVAAIDVINEVGGQYSSSQTSQRYANSTTRQIELIDETIFAEPTQIYQIRYTGKDIRVRVKNLSTVNFS
jgi:hypothetical protein